MTRKAPFERAAEGIDPSHSPDSCTDGALPSLVSELVSRSAKNYRFEYILRTSPRFQEHFLEELEFSKSTGERLEKFIGGPGYLVLREEDERQQYRALAQEYIKAFVQLKRLNERGLVRQLHAYSAGPRLTGRSRARRVLLDAVLVLIAGSLFLSCLYRCFQNPSAWFVLEIPIIFTIGGCISYCLERNGELL